MGSKWTVKAMVALLGVGALLAVSAAGSQGSETKGKYFFKKNCKPCHGKNTAAGEVTPLTKTQAQWKSYFAAGKHAKGKEQLGTILTPEQMLDVQTFLVNHASDSPQPETCGG